LTDRELVCRRVVRFTEQTDGPDYAAAIAGYTELSLFRDLCKVSARAQSGFGLRVTAWMRIYDCMTHARSLATGVDSHIRTECICNIYL